MWGLRDLYAAAGLGQWGAIQAVAPSFGVELSPIDAREVERGITAFARSSNGGLIITSSGTLGVQRDLVTTLASRYRLPSVYPWGYYVKSGGLVSYGPDSVDPFRRAASYVDRILRGEKPADLPVQAPTKYHLGTSKNSRYRSDATKLPANDFASFPFRFINVHCRLARDWQREQFFEVPT